MKIVKTILCFLLLVAALPWTDGQFPRACTTLASLKTKTCCPIPKNFVQPCGSDGNRGTCEELIIRDWNLNYSHFEPFQSDDERHNWPHALYNRTCKCKDNFGGYDCGKCEFGYYGINCTVKKTLKRRNFLNLSDREKDRDMWCVINSRYDLRYYVVVSVFYDEINAFVKDGRDPSGLFYNVSSYDLIMWMHYYSARMIGVTSCLDDNLKRNGKKSTPLLVSLKISAQELQVLLCWTEFMLTMLCVSILVLIFCILLVLLYNELEERRCLWRLYLLTIFPMARVTPKRMHFFNGLFSVFLSFLLASWFFSGAVNNNVQDEFGRKPVFWCTKLTNEDITQMSVKGTYRDMLSVCLDIPYNQQENRSIKNSKTIPRMSHVANISFNRHSSALMPFVLAFFLFGPVNANVQEHYGQNAVLWKTKLTYEEITRMSVKVGPDWDKLAALMDIPYYQREEIRLNSSKYPNFYSKAEQVLVYFDKRRSLTRHHLNNFFKELDRYDLKNEMLPAEIQGGSYKEENAQLQEGDSIFDSNDTLHLRDDTPLSSREMYKFSLHIPNWNALAGHMNVSSAERNDIRNNSFYPDNRSKAEKILWIFNTREDFSREKLAHGLKEISQPQLIKPVINGEWRSCELKHEEREEQLESGLKPEDHREKSEVPEMIPRKEKFPRNPSNRRSSWFPRFLLAFLFSSVVNNNIPERHDEKPILWSRELTSAEITRMSVKVGPDWDKLAGLMDVPFSQREEIRLNYSKYPDLASKAVQVFVHFNKSKGFSRHDLKKFFKELGRHDLEIELISVGNQSVTYKEESASSISECFVHENIGKPYLRDDIRLSSREICKLGGDIADSWYTLAGLLNISYARRNDIRNNVLYHDNRSRAEKILSIFNNREDFSRLKLANFLKEISQQQLVNPVITGELRNVIPKRTRFAHHRSKRNFPALFRLVLGVFLGSAVKNNEQDDYGEKPVSWNTKLSNEEIIGISQEVGADWDKLAGLMNVPYNKREEIRFNFSSFSSKAEQSLRYYNESKVFSRHDLKKIFKQLDRSDLETQMVSLGIQSGNNGTENASARSECSIYANSAHLQDKPLSSRETCRLSQKIGDWDTLAGVMNIPSAERTNIRNNNVYYDDCSRAEKILSLFNNREDFSRERLASHFEEISELFLKNMVETGELRSL